MTRCSVCGRKLRQKRYGAVVFGKQMTDWLNHAVWCARYGQEPDA